MFFSGDLGRINKEGILQFVGRNDDMMKVRGYRIELPAIELALRQIDSIMEVAISAPEMEKGNVGL